MIIFTWYILHAVACFCSPPQIRPWPRLALQAMPYAAPAHGYPPAHSGVPKPGDAVEVYSDTAKQWLSATVLRSDGSLTVGYQRNSESVEKTLPWPCHTHLRAAGGAFELSAPAAAPPRIRPVCRVGIKCKIREPQHVTTFAHPFDPDYKHCCSHSGVIAEMASLRNLFTWVDADGSGKISLKELQAALPLLERLQGERLMLTKESWDLLDEDPHNAHGIFAQYHGMLIDVHGLTDFCPYMSVLICVLPGALAQIEKCTTSS